MRQKKSGWKRPALLFLVLLLLAQIGDIVYLQYFDTSRRRLPVLMYHHFADEAKEGTVVTPVRFREQMDALDALGIPWDDTPGVSSFCGAAAALETEYTLPGVSQSVILTRMSGRTAVPEGEAIAALAAHGASMAIFLSAGMLTELQAELLKGAYTPDTPAALVYKATWPEEKTVRCTVGTLARAGQEHQISKTALVLVGNFLGKDYQRSKLYDPAFTTGFREGQP